MQFTELSELNKVVGMMRVAACNSPTFHDRQDSEVDRIFNSSPKMELQLRNSWIDKMAAFKPAATGAASSPGKKPAPATASAAAAAAAAAVAANGAAKTADAKTDESSAENGADAKAHRRLAGAGKAAKGAYRRTM